MALLLTLNSVNRVQGDTNDLIFTIQWPPRFNGVDGRCWRVCVRSFAMPSSTSMNTPWAELRLRVGSAESLQLEAMSTVSVTHVIPISAATGQLTEVWTESTVADARDLCIAPRLGWKFPRLPGPLTKRSHCPGSGSANSNSSLPFACRVSGLRCWFLEI